MRSGVIQSFQFIIKINKKMKYTDFRKKIKMPLFSTQDIKFLGVRVFGYQLTLWQKRGYITKIKNGLYAFSETIGQIVPEELAGRLYGPSYISLEKALSFYGLIPEMVYSVTSVTPKTTREFKNKSGHFKYRNIKPDLFFGYKQKQGKIFPYLLAEPEKALLDLIYFNRLKTRDDLSGLRINWKNFKGLIKKQKIKKYMNAFGPNPIYQFLLEKL